MYKERQIDSQKKRLIDEDETDGCILVAGPEVQK